jgi:hypothetical protein
MRLSRVPGQARLTPGGTSTNPQQGLQAAFDNSRALIEGVRQWLAQTEPATR